MHGMFPITRKLEDGDKMWHMQETEIAEFARLEKQVRREVGASIATLPSQQVCRATAAA